MIMYDYVCCFRLYIQYINSTFLTLWIFGLRNGFDFELRFLADGPPSGGIVQCSPQSGYAVTSSFSGTTFAWYDEDVSCPSKSLDGLKPRPCGTQVSTLTYAYYLLPFTQNLGQKKVVQVGLLLLGDIQGISP